MPEGENRNLAGASTGVSPHAARIAEWTKAQTAPLVGWDFREHPNKPVADPLPWDYLAVARPLVDGARRMLDLGTGGGEVLLGLAPLPSFSVVTELSEPRAQVAKQRLLAQGACAAVLDSTVALPFRPDAFDLVLCRNSAFVAAHVSAVVEPGGAFLTQQVARGNLADLLDLLGAGDGNPDWQFPDQAAADLEAAGFAQVDLRTADSFFEFVSVDAMLWFLNAILPGHIDVEACHEGLSELQVRADRGEKLRFTRRRYLLQARK
jgi:SAM-dependent methyltransferase